MKTAIIQIDSSVSSPSLAGDFECDFTLSEVRRCVVKKISCGLNVYSYGDNSGVIKDVDFQIANFPVNNNTVNISPHVGSIIRTNLNLTDKYQLETNMLIPPNNVLYFVGKVFLNAPATSDVDFVAFLIIDYDEL